jgi:aminoglycoside phosphotransferase (APT) family kinase protein
MSLSLPPSKAVLSGILAELENSVLPALKDPYAGQMTQLSCYLLRVLIAREDKLDGILRRGIDEASALLGHGSPGNPASVLQEYGRLSGLIERRIDETSDERWVRTAVSAELELIEAVDAAATRDSTIGAPAIPARVTPDMVNACLRRRLPRGNVFATEVKSVGGGHSKDTFMVGLDGPSDWGREVVIRRDVPYGTGDTSVVDEYPLIESLHALGYPVPRPLLLEPGPNELGAPFAIMARVPGEPAARLGTEGTAKLIIADEARRCAPQFARALATLHNLDLSKLGHSAESLALPVEEHIRNRLRRMRDHWTACRLAPSATLAAGFDWLETHVPRRADARTCLLHGDATPRNFMVHEAGIRLLDWELSHLGDASEDLYLIRHEMSQVMPWEDFLAEYRRAGGLALEPADEEYYRMWVLVRNAAGSAACLQGGVRDKSLDIRWSYTGIYYYYAFLRQIAQFLLR